MKQDRNQQRPRAQAPGFAQDGQSGGIGSPFPPAKLDMLVHTGLVLCLITLLLGTSVFVVSAASGTVTGYYLGYVGEAFRRSAIYLSIPFWLAAWVSAASSRGSRVQLQWSRLLPCLLFTLYALVQLLISNPLLVAASVERLLSTAPIVLLALPLCSRKGCNLFWTGMAVAGLVFFVSLLISGQLLSALRGEGFQSLTMETSTRLDLGMDTITSASMMYQCVLAGVFWLVANSGKVGSWLIGVPIYVGLCGTAILTGSKGPAVAFGLALLTILVGGRSKRNIYAFLAVGILATALWEGREILSYYVGSVSHLSIGLEDENRLQFYQFAIESVPTLFGNGVGSWSVGFGLGPGNYVHNSLLEVYYEMGAFGVGLFLWAVGNVGLSVFRAARSRRDPVAGFILAYYVYGLVFSMVSGTIFGDTVFLLGLVLGCTRFDTPMQIGAAAHATPSDTRQSLPSNSRVVYGS